MPEMSIKTGERGIESIVWLKYKLNNVGSTMLIVVPINGLRYIGLGCRDN
jgi:hypothetical protein